jgi:hypothetical protein
MAGIPEITKFVHPPEFQESFKHRKKFKAVVKKFYSHKKITEFDAR